MDVKEGIRVLAAGDREPKQERRVDGSNVLVPAFYGDTGGPGWYAELQQPVQRRLAVEFRSAWRRDVYVRPAELIIPRFNKLGDDRILRDRFGRFGLVSITKVDCYQSPRHWVIILRFESPESAAKALDYVDVMQRRGSLQLPVDTCEVNVHGPTAFTIRDVLLVKEPVGKESSVGKEGPSHHIKTQEEEDEEEVSRALRAYESGTCELVLHGEEGTYQMAQSTRLSEKEPSSSSEPSRISKRPRPPPLVLPARSTSLAPHTPAFVLAPNTIPTPLEPNQWSTLPQLKLSTRADYQRPPHSYPHHIAIAENRLLVGDDPREMISRFPSARPISVCRLSRNVLDKMGMEEFKGYRWAADGETKNKWKQNKGCIAIPLSSLAR